MNVVFLGTSSATPTPWRFLPSFAVTRLGEMFLFDCGEGAQIRFRKARLKFSRLKWVLISHLHGDHITGLMGLLMSLQMAEHAEPLRIVGPEGLRDYVLANKRLLRTDFGYELQFQELTGDGAIVHDGDEYVIEAGLLKHRVPTYGFALAEKDRPGTFNLEAAAALGVPVGPLFGALQQGRSVTLADGRQVFPDQCARAAEAGPAAVLHRRHSPVRQRGAAGPPGRSADPRIHIRRRTGRRSAPQRARTSVDAARDPRWPPKASPGPDPLLAALCRPPNPCGPKPRRCSPYVEFATTCSNRDHDPRASRMRGPSRVGWRGGLRPRLPPTPNALGSRLLADTPRRDCHDDGTVTLVVGEPWRGRVSSWRWRSEGVR